MKKLPRGLRNCNPGNIRRSTDVFQGEKKSSDLEFKQFKSMAYGYRAIFKILSNYHRHYHLDTIRKMITRWAPANENNTEAYVKRVSEFAGVDSDERVDINDKSVMTRIVGGMSRVENGVDPEMNDILAGWELL